MTSGSAEIPDQPWTQTGDRRTWQAVIGGLVLTVTRLTSGGFVAVVDGPAGPVQSPVLMTRLGAQAWAESRAAR
jgi:hypothetical protein